MNQPAASDLSLQELIRTLKGDRTYMQLEEASGGVVKAQRWNQIVNTPDRLKEFPEPRSIEAMALALNVNIEVLVLAFAHAVGLDVQRHRSIFADLLPPIVDKLTDKQRDAVLSHIRAYDEIPAADDRPPALAGGRKKSRNAKTPRKGVPPI